MEKKQDDSTTKRFYIIIGTLILLVLILAALLYREMQQTDKTQHALPEKAVSIPDAGRNSPASALTADPFLMMDHFMQQFFKAVNTSPFESSMSGSLESWADFTPAIDLEETDQAYHIRADLPGMEKDQINITVQDRYLTLQGIRKKFQKTEDAQKGYFAQERSYGSFSRSIVLPGPVDETAIKADYQNGVLTITLPKLAQAKTSQKIKIE